MNNQLTKKLEFPKIMLPSFLSFYLNSSIRYFIPAILPIIIVNLNISVFYGSLLITSYWLGYTFFQIPAGIISDKIGLAITAKISFLGIFLLFIFLFLMINSYTALIFIQFLLGMSSAAVYVSDASLVQAWVPRKKRSMSIGTYQTAYFIGASIGEFITLKLINISFDLPFYFIIILLFGIALINFIFLKEPLHRKKQVKNKISRDIAYVALIRFSAGFSYLGFLSLYSTFIVFSHLVLTRDLFLYMWIPAAGGIITSPLGGIISKKYIRAKAKFAVSTTLILAIFIMFIGFIHGYILLFLTFFTGFFYGLYAGPSMGMASDVSGGDKNIGSSSGIINFSSQVGGSISPVLIGYIFTVYHVFFIPFIILGLVSIIALIPVIIKIKKSAIGDPPEA